MYGAALKWHTLRRNKYTTYDFTKTVERECIRDHDSRMQYEQYNDLKDLRGEKHKYPRNRKGSWGKDKRIKYGCRKYEKETARQVKRDELIWW